MRRSTDAGLQTPRREFISRFTAACGMGLLLLQALTAGGRAQVLVQPNYPTNPGFIDFKVQGEPGSAGAWRLQESRDFRFWHDLTWGTRSTRPGEGLRLPTGNGAGFFRTASAAALPPPEPIPEDDLFYPYLRRVPPWTTVFSDETADGVRLRKFRFANFEGTAEGGIQPNEVYAVLAEPVVRLPRAHPGILICHGGNGVAQDFMALWWAKLGFIAVAVELPGLSNPETQQSLSRHRTLDVRAWDAIPNARASTLFDAILAALGAFNLVSEHPDVDPKRVAVSGSSLGGYVSIMLCALLDERVRSAFSLFGTAYFMETVWREYLLGKTEEERRRWLAHFDPAPRLKRVRASILLYAASNDTYFYQSAAQQTLDAILSEKCLCIAPGVNHDFTLPGGTQDSGGAAWASGELLFHTENLAGGWTPVPRLTRVSQSRRSLRLEAVAMPQGGELWAYVSTNVDERWWNRIWRKAPLERTPEGLILTLPARVTVADWFAGVTFSRPLGERVLPMSLSTPIHRSHIPP